MLSTKYLNNKHVTNIFIHQLLAQLIQDSKLTNLTNLIPKPHLLPSSKLQYSLSTIRHSVFPDECTVFSVFIIQFVQRPVSSVFNIQFTVYNVFSAHCPVYCVNDTVCPVCSFHYKVYLVSSVHYTLCSVYSASSVHCVVYSVSCMQHTVCPVCSIGSCQICFC